MAGTVDLVFTISKKLYKAVKSGNAVLQSGGVRNLSGQLLELAKPAAKAASTVSLGPVGIATMCVNTASSLASNVQCAIIQKSVNEANVKLDEVLEKVSGIAGSLQSVQTLSWVTSAFSLANCGISVAGFYFTMQKINSVQGELRAFIDQYTEDKKNDAIQELDGFIGHLLTDLNGIQNVHKNETYGNDYFDKLETNVSNHIDDCIPFIKRVIIELRKDTIDSKLACQVIFTLSSLLIEVINEFCCAYYFVHHKQHGRYSKWVKFVEELILNDDFRSFMKKHIKLDAEYADMLPREKSAAIQIVFDSIEKQLQKVETCQCLKYEMSEEEFSDIDKTLNQRLYRMISEESEKERNLSLDDILMQRIMAYDISDDIADDELIAISMN